MCAILRRDNNRFGARAEGKTLIRKTINLSYRTGKDVKGCKQPIQWKVEPLAQSIYFCVIQLFRFSCFQGQMKKYKADGSCSSPAQTDTAETP